LVNTRRHFGTDLFLYIQGRWGQRFLRNVRNYLPINRVLHSRRLEFTWTKSQ